MLDKPKRFLKTIQLKNKQRAVNKQYEKEGKGEPSDEVLEKQIEINTLRNELDIPDKNNIIDEKYVQ